MGGATPKLDPIGFDPQAFGGVPFTKGSLLGKHACFYLQG